MINEVKKKTKILVDFEKFIKHLDKNQVRVTKTQEFINGGTLLELNDLMQTDQTADSHNRTPQYKFPLLNFFYHLALAGKIFKIDYSHSKKYLVEAKNLEPYQTLSESEKYLFLLETFWLDCDWEKLQAPKKNTNFENESEEFFNKLLEKRKIIVNDELEYHLGAFIDYFTYLGLWEVDFLKLKLTAPGKKIIPILLNSWPFTEFNLSYLRKLGLDIGIYGKRMAFEDPFWFALMDLFPEARGTIPRFEYTEIEGNYIFKIKLGKVWRKIKISTSATLADLHLAIQQAFNFDDDHLYSFFMSNRAWDGPGYGRLEEGMGFNACEKKLFELGLEAGREFIYIFDYGTEWEFKIKTEKFIEEEEVLEAAVVDSRGENPEQYRL
ncbi:MAG: plasmid pRiA4b ORF-3 family protein [Halanaerobium sp.]